MNKEELSRKLNTNMLLLIVILMVLCIIPGLLILLPQQYLIFVVSLFISASKVRGGNRNPTVQPFDKEILKVVLELHRAKIVGYTLIALGVLPMFLILLASKM